MVTTRRLPVIDAVRYKHVPNGETSFFGLIHHTEAVDDDLAAMLEDYRAAHERFLELLNEGND
ncbi:hypothetical protein [Acidipropionibacterium timonense]|uniref:hypothetical protein n=1 Tax=Acidipropionibacterium timonense TaxID=2161818 RepID=UPI0010304A33|nr:hypothetical protein [Acidipropionibacterium timonense]